MKLLPLLRPAALATLLLPLWATARHSEELTLRPLPHVAKTLAHFHFATHERASDAVLAPSVLRQILTKYDAASFHLSFSVGQYSDARYGPPHSAMAENNSAPNVFHAPFGARLQVAFRGDEPTSGAFAARWRGVTSELGGVFSASLNRMDETTTTRGAALERGALEPAADNCFFQASLAREELCTENLTPWLKMLPCRAHTGLGVLVDPLRILSGEYAMLSVFAARDDSGDWSVHQRLTTVQPSARDASWSLGALLLDGVATHVAACPLATHSAITTESSPPVTLDLKTQHAPVSTTQSWLLAAEEQEQTTASPGHTAPPLDGVAAVHRFQTGYGQVHGGLAVRLENRDPECAMLVTYNDVAPWFLRLYFHTLQHRVVSLDDGAVLDPRTAAAVEFVPAELRGRPNQFRVQTTLPPRTALVLSVQFDKVFVRLSEHPPDANRGFDIPSGVATFTRSAATESCQASAPSRSSPRRHVVYSEPLLIALPTPDFSMPYNVITLTSTVVAFFAGSMLNTLLRKAPRIQRMLADAPAKTL